MEKSAYQSPPWAASAAPQGYSLEILKEGTIIETVPLDCKTHYILGRMGGSVDILMEHVSISRQHCCLQFRDDGVLMALDLGSAQGSFLNKVKLVKEVYQRVNVGDILRFGASTRMYIVNGPAEQMPSEYDSANMKSYREKLQQKTAKAEAKNLQAAHVGASWGFDEDAENPQSDEDEEAEEEQPDYVKNDSNYERKHGKKYSAGLSEESAETGSKEVSEKDAAILDKIRMKEKKIQNMQEEIRRIYLKESGQPDGLTEGQSAAVSRNDERIKELKESIDDLLEVMKLKGVHRDGKSAEQQKKEKKVREDADNNEMLDTTSQTADITTNWRLKKKLAKQGNRIRDIKSQSGGADQVDNVLTYEDLKRLRDEQLGVTREIQGKASELEEIIRNVTQYFSLLKDNETNQTMRMDNVDAVETFVLEARSKEALLSLKALRIEEATAASKLRGIEKLLKIATPALQSLKTITAHPVHPVISSSSGSQSGISSGSASSSASKKHEKHEKSDVDEKNTFIVPWMREKEKDKEQDASKDAEVAGAGSRGVDRGKDPPGRPVSGPSKQAETQSNNTSSSDKEKEKEKDKEKDTSKLDKSLEEGKKESKKRLRLEETNQMQSLSSFVKFAEAEKRKNELGERQRELRELNGEEGGGGEGGEEEKDKGEKVVGAEKKKIRATNEFSSSTFEIGKADSKYKDADRRREKGPKGPSDSTNSTDTTTSSYDTSDGMVPSKKMSGPKGPSKGPPSGGMLEGGEAVWLPPKNQTGDGKTALNARLGY